MASASDVLKQIKDESIEWVDLQLSDQRQLTLDGHDDIAAIPAMVESTPSGRR